MKEKKCKKLYEEDNIKIIKCDRKYFLVTGGKRVKIGPLEGEKHSTGNIA